MAVLVHNIDEAVATVAAAGTAERRAIRTIVIARFERALMASAYGDVYRGVLDERAARLTLGA